MTSITPVVTLSPRDYDAVLFDLVGVVTKTASAHAAAWKRSFDTFLKRRAADTGQAFVPFTDEPRLTHRGLLATTALLYPTY
jgi:beta-phosphoglucomutase-like phosphatase (HAD superfamily)